MRYNRKFSASLDYQSLQKLAQELRDYERSLEDKCELFVKRLADSGIQVAKLLSQVTSEGDIVADIVLYKTELHRMPKGCKGLVIGLDSKPLVKKWLRKGKVVSNTISPILMLEYGSGKYAVEGHRGTYPRDDGNASLGLQDSWHYVDLQHKLHTVDGIQPTMPMFNAFLEMQNNIDRIAKEVFRE